MNSERTQIARRNVSVPMRWITENVDLYGNVLHFGEGRAYSDTDAVANLPGVRSVRAYDPNSVFPVTREVPEGFYDFGIANYVFNTLEDHERRPAFRHFWSLSDRMIVTVRTDKVPGMVLDDGVVTKRGTFQTQMDQHDWTMWFANQLHECNIPQKAMYIEVLHRTSNYIIFELR